MVLGIVFLAGASLLIYAQASIKKETILGVYTCGNQNVAMGQPYQLPHQYVRVLFKKKKGAWKPYVPTSKYLQSDNIRLFHKQYPSKIHWHVFSRGKMKGNFDSKNEPYPLQSNYTGIQTIEKGTMKVPIHSSRLPKQETQYLIANVEGSPSSVKVEKYQPSQSEISQILKAIQALKEYEVDPTQYELLEAYRLGKEAKLVCLNVKGRHERDCQCGEARHGWLENACVVLVDQQVKVISASNIRFIDAVLLKGEKLPLYLFNYESEFYDGYALYTQKFDAYVDMTWEYYDVKSPQP